MKKTISVNIKGISFTIEEDAYDILQEYLERLESALGMQTGSKEILEDIELRIAELFNLRLNDSKSVIELIDVQEILANLGNPEDFVDQNDDEESEESEYRQEAHASYEKRLFRDEENATFAGVCAGIANYFNMDVVIIRIIFVIIFLFAGFGLPLYIILWIAIPKAKSTIDRLRMKGRPITVENVKSEVENAAEKIKDGSRRFARKVSDSDNYRKRVSNGARILTSIIGIGLIIFGIFQLIGLVIFLSLGNLIGSVNTAQGSISMLEFIELTMSNSADVTWLWIGGLMMSISAILFTFLLGSILFFRLRNRWGKFSLLGLFIFATIGFFICLNVAIRTTVAFSAYSETEVPIGSSTSKELTLLPESETLDYDSMTNMKLYGISGQVSLVGEDIKDFGIAIEYVPSADSLFHVYKTISARGITYDEVLMRIEHIHHTASLNNDTLRVNTDYTFPKKDKLRDQEVTIVIEVPAGGQVKFKDKVVYLSNDGSADEVEHRYYKERGYIRGDGTYRHRDSNNKFHFHHHDNGLDQVAIDIEDEMLELEEELEEIEEQLEEND